MKQQPVSQPEQVQSHLLSLGLTTDVLVEAVRRGASARFSSTRHDPPFAPGIMNFIHQVRALRDLLCGPHKWTRSDRANFSTVVSPDGKIAIAVASGDDATGTDRDPCTQHPKGPLTAAAVRLNQLGLFGAAQNDDEDETTERPTTWFLLTYAGPSELRAELALPEFVNDAGWITKWKHRLVLPAIPLDEVPVVGAGETFAEAGDEFDVQVVRKG